MPKPNPRPAPDVARVIEKQMRNWELARAQQPGPLESPPREVEEFVAISRVVGAGGHSLATLLHERLGWPVFDREILDAMAGDDQIRRRLYEKMDERDIGWLEGMLRWLVEGGYSQEHYLRQLSATVLALARKGRAIFLGRGADLILPRDRGLRLRLVAPLEHCAKGLAERAQISEALARAEVERIERIRTEFVRTFFGRPADDATRYDLICNTARVSLREVAEIVCQLLSQRGVLS